MKTKAILAAAAAAFLLASPVFAHEMQSGETKRCYRTLHKVPFPVRVSCPKPKESAPTLPHQAQKPPAPQPSTPPNS